MEHILVFEDEGINGTGPLSDWYVEAVLVVLFFVVALADLLLVVIVYKLKVLNGGESDTLQDHVVPWCLVTATFFHFNIFPGVGKVDDLVDKKVSHVYGVIRV